MTEEFDVQADFAKIERKLDKTYEDLPEVLVRMWMHVWNKVKEKTGDSKRAFATAYGVLKKRAKKLGIKRKQGEVVGRIREIRAGLLLIEDEDDAVRIGSYRVDLEGGEHCLNCIWRHEADGLCEVFSFKPSETGWCEMYSSNNGAQAPVNPRIPGRGRDQAAGDEAEQVMAVQPTGRTSR